MTSATMDMRKSNHTPARSSKRPSFSKTLRCIVALGCAVIGQGVAVAQTPAVGAKVPDFTLQTPTGSTVTLAKEYAKGTTVLIVLRGYPGYQCPYCVKQVHDFVEHSSDFAARKANVVLGTLALQLILISMPRNSLRRRQKFRRTSGWSLIRPTR